MMKITADFSSITGKIRPLHGFNNAARKTGYGDLLPKFAELNAPVIRLHDTCGFYGGAHYVDIPNIFPNPSADPDDERAYDFTLTDMYIKPIILSGSQILFRLGVTIEHAPKKYHIFPPENPHKWASICEHIVRHYNDGWADGFHYGIKYWEIWNEPDGLDKDVEPNGPPMWLGTARQYYELYSITANHIKAMHPSVIIGGYSSCYILGAFRDGKWREGYTDFFTDFLKYISSPETKAPLDFFSYHGYLGKNYLEKIEKEYTFVRSTLDRFGFCDTAVFNTEWNTNIESAPTDDRRTMYYINMRNHYGAAHAAGALFEMQRIGVDTAMFYDAQLWWEYGCLFNVPELTPTKTYYAFKCFSKLYCAKNECEVHCENGLYACGASGETDILGISNTGDNDITAQLVINGCRHKMASVYETGETCTDEKLLECETKNLKELTIKANSFVYIIFED